MKVVRAGDTAMENKLYRVYPRFIIWNDSNECPGATQIRCPGRLYESKPAPSSMSIPASLGNSVTDDDKSRAKAR